jgi:hypothetical protein
MKARLLDDLPLATDTVGALEVAASRRSRRPVGTFDILAAIIDVDQAGDWARVQVRANPISITEAHRFGDADASTGGHWRNVPLTADATRALKVAARIADAHHLLPIPPGILALGLVQQADSGAARALLQGADLTHAQLLKLLQDTVGARLMALDVAVGDAVAAHPEDSAGRQDAAMLDRQIEELLRAAAGAVPASRDRAYQLLTTAAVMLLLVSRDRPLWERATVQIGISLEAYEANLRWACAHPTEKVGSRETQLDAALAGIRLTDELSGAIEAAERIASRLAGSEVPEVAGILAAVLLTVEGADARSGLAEPARLSLREAVLQTVYGALVPNFDALVTEGRAAQAPATSDTPERKPPGSETVGFNIGTFVGAFVVAAVGGVPWNVALVLAWLVRTVAARQRKKARSQRLLPAAASAALVAAVALAVTAATDFEDDRRAVEKVNAARQAIDRADSVQAIRNLGAAALLENQSVSIRVLASCVDWALGFKDIAVLEAQEALNLGYRPQEASHYKGRGCFLDTSDFHGVTFMKTSGSTWLILPRPKANDAVAQRYFEIAYHERLTKPSEAFLAIACLADRYDLRMLAAHMFTAGMNGNMMLGGQPTPFSEIRSCMRARALKARYRFFTDPRTNMETYVPADMPARVPTPKNPRPPAGACWAKFPSSAPCNADE